MNIRVKRITYCWDDFKDLYNDGFSDTDIAKELHCNQATVSYHRRKQGLLSNYEKTFHKLRFWSKEKKESFIKRWNDDEKVKNIALEFGISESHVSLTAKKFELRKRERHGGIDMWLLKQRKKAYFLRKQGLTDHEIADVMGTTIETVQLRIGRYLMSQCREEPSCPYKALLPEYNESSN